METTKTVVTTTKVVGKDANRDPMTGQPGAHPVGVGAGAAGAGVAGAVIGAAVAGPVGAAVGAVAGAIAGGAAGHVAAEAINPTIEHAYWRTEFASRPYVTKGSTYDQYGPAYQYGWENYTKSGSRVKSFDEIEGELRSAWDKHRANSTLSWENAKAASRDAWQRVEKAAGGHCCA